MAPEQDPRFAALAHDPRFMRPKKAATKLKIDARFSSMLRGQGASDFGTGSSAVVDKYGRPTKRSTASDLKKFYHLEEGEEAAAEGKGTRGSESDHSDAARQSESEGESEEDVASTTTSAASEGVSGYALARGGGDIESSSEEEDDDDGDSEGDAEARDSSLSINPLAQDNVPTGGETARLAIVNMDWDNVRAIDLFMVLDSLKPKGGILHSVTIYPSAFGRERMALEQVQGPPKSIFKRKDGLIQEDDEKDVFDEEELRKYQLERLRYYYAVAECDSVHTARTLYQTCDGTEFEKTSNFFDLRYIPEGMEFTDTEPKDVCTGVGLGYEPREYTTDALQHSKIKLTWDEDDLSRKTVMRRKFTKEDLQDMDFRVYLASSSGEESEEGEGGDAEEEGAVDPRVYAELARGAVDGAHASADEEESQEMEITFTPGLVDRGGAADATGATTESNENLTVFEAYLKKKKQQRKEKKRAKAALLKSQAKSSGAGGEDEAGSPAADARRGADAEDDALVSDEGDLLDEGREQDLAFDDPFFTGSGKRGKPANKAAAASKSKEAQHPTREAADGRERAELELLVMDDVDTLNKHFSVQDVLKQEKERANKRKRKRKSASKKGALELAEGTQDAFEVDVQDPRFQGLYQSHHFAIDPLNPHYKKTRAMGHILETRAKLAGPAASATRPAEERAAPARSTADAAGPASTGGTDDLSGLVQRLKHKAVAPRKKM